MKNRLRTRLLASLLALWLLPAAALHAQTTTIDVLVVYVPAVTAYYNGAEGVEAQLLATFAGSNAALANSQIPITLNLVHSAEVNYTEVANNMSTDLNRLKSTNDGYMDEIHQLRETYGADLVCLIRKDPAGSTGGIALLLGNAAGSPGSGFSVVAAESMLNDFAFAHELGHNMGSLHSRSDPNAGSPLFPYSYGYRFTGANGVQYHDIMAYYPGALIPYFANPSVSYQGVATGIAAGDPNAANVALTFAQTGPVVAAYRATQALAAQITVQPKDITITRGSSTTLRSGARGAAPLTFQWLKSLPGATPAAIAGATGFQLATGSLNNAMTYRMQATNGQNSVTSRTATVYVVDPPAGPYPIGVQQSLIQAGYGLSLDFPQQWQTVVPTNGYLHSLDVYLFRSGVGALAPPVIELSSPTGELLVSYQIPSATTISGSGAWISIPTKQFVTPGLQYRITMRVAPGETGGGEISWGGAGISGASSLLTNSVDQADWAPQTYIYAYRLNGVAALTYQTWAAGRGLQGSAADPGATSGSDGLPNLIRYFLNLDTAAAATGLPAMGSVTTTAGSTYLPFVFRKRKTMVDAAPVVQSSLNLTSWQAAPSVTIVQLPDADASTAVYEARVPVSVPLSNLFLRLQVGLPNP